MCEAMNMDTNTDSSPIEPLITSGADNANAQNALNLNERANALQLIDSNSLHSHTSTTNLEKESTINGQSSQNNQASSSSHSKAFYSLKGKSGSTNDQGIRNSFAHRDRSNKKSSQSKIIKIIFRTNEFKEKFQKSCTELDEYVKNNLKCPISSSYFDRYKNYYVVVENEEHANEIMTSTLFFPQEIKVNLSVETNPITITKICLKALGSDPELRSKLMEMGITGFDKLIKSHDEEKGIFKAFCKNSHDRLKILMRGEFVIETEKLKYHVNAKPLVWPLEACRRCHKFTNLHPKNGNSYRCSDNDPLACEKCNNFDHKTNECKESLAKCVNCGGTGHSSTEKRQCWQYTKWEEKTLTDKLNKLLESSHHRRLMSGEGYKKGKLILNSYDVSAFGLNKAVKKSNHSVSLKQQTQMQPYQRDPNSYSSRTSSVMDTLSDRLRILENESHQKRSTAPSTGSNRSIPSYSGESLSSNPDSIMNWSKNEFLYNIRQSTQSTINESLQAYRQFQAVEIDHMLEEREYLLEKKILNKVQNNDFTTNAPANKETYNKRDYDEIFQRRLLQLDSRYAPTHGLGHNGNNQF
jgi:hypothetical protein